MKCSNRQARSVMDLPPIGTSFSDIPSLSSNRNKESWLFQYYPAPDALVGRKKEHSRQRWSFCLFASLWSPDKHEYLGKREEGKSTGANLAGLFVQFEGHGTDTWSEGNSFVIIGSIEKDGVLMEPVHFPSFTLKESTFIMMTLPFWYVRSIFMLSQAYGSFR